MGFCDNQILPRLINLACGLEPIRAQRQKIVPHAAGRILEVGVGTGLNMAFYNKSKVDVIYGLEPNLKARDLAASRIAGTGLNVDFIGLDGQDIPLGKDAVDTVVLTYTLCTIPDAVKAVTEMRRVLKPGGRLLFCEHGKAPDAGVARWQDRITPTWKRLFGGCHLNRDIPGLLQQGGFHIEQQDTAYVTGPKVAGFTYWGAAG